MSFQLEKYHSISSREGIGSRLTPFVKLPHIGESNEYIPHPPKNKSLEENMKINPRLKQYKKNEKILIAIRLSDGRRLEKEFYSNDEIFKLIEYLKKENISFNEDSYFSSGDVPKRQFQNFSLTFSQANIQTHTMNEEEEKSSGNIYRDFLKNQKIFLTEIPRRNSSLTNRSESKYSNESRSLTSLSISDQGDNLNVDLISTRQKCRQRLSNCSKKKLSLLISQQENDKRYSKFGKFLEDLERKRRTNIRQYEIELRDYLFKRLEIDQLKENISLINQKIEQLIEESKKYLSIRQLLEQVLLYFPSEGASKNIKGLILRYETLVKIKKSLQEKDYDLEKLKLLKTFQKFTLEHNTEVTRLNTRIVQLHEQLNQLEEESRNEEQKLLFQMDLKRTKTKIISQLESCINYLYERYRLLYQIEKGSDDTITQKLKTIQDFILYRKDLLQRAKQ